MHPMSTIWQGGDNDQFRQWTNESIDFRSHSLVRAPRPPRSRVPRFDDLGGGQWSDVPPRRAMDECKAHVGALPFGVGGGSGGVCHVCGRVGHPKIPRLEREVYNRKDPRNHRLIELGLINLESIKLESIELESWVTSCDTCASLLECIPTMLNHHHYFLSIAAYSDTTGNRECARCFLSRHNKALTYSCF